MTKEPMYGIKISASDLARLAPEVTVTGLVGRQELLQYLTRPNGGFWVLEPVPAEATTSTEHTCAGYPGCDGDLPGEEHSTGCPAAHTLAEKAMSAFLQADHLRPEEAGRSRKAVDAVIRLVQQDSNARWDKAILETYLAHGMKENKQFRSEVLARVKAESLPPTLQDRIMERFKTQKILNSSVWSPAELAAIAIEEITKETK